MLGREDIPQSHLALQRAFSLDIAPAVADAMNVNIYAYRRQAKGHRAHQISRLAAYAGEFDQIFYLGGISPPKSSFNAFGKALRCLVFSL
jgi:hypothetical protein